jgi:hypothetical protein
VDLEHSIALLPSCLSSIKRQTNWGWWLTSAILATQEAEIRRIKVEASPGKEFVKPYPRKTHHKKGLVEVGSEFKLTHTQKKTNKKNKSGLMVPACHPSAPSGGWGKRILSLRQVWAS